MPTLASVSGTILDLSNASTQATVNAAWKRLQEFLTSTGICTLIGDQVITGLPACASLDPASQSFVSWTGCSDGVNIFPAPVVPSNLMNPLVVWERQSGINMPFITPPMEQMLDGLPGWPKGILNRRWEWREDSIFLPGAQQSFDLRIRYNKYFPDFNDVGTAQWFDQPLPIVHGSDALAWFVVAEIVGSRNMADAAAAEGLGEVAARRIVNRETKSKQRVNVRRQGRSGWGGGCG
jgi:hypothetical protein